MLYFLGWMVFLAGVVLSVPIAAFIEKRKQAPRPLPPEPEPEIEESQPIEYTDDAPIPEDELEKRLRRLRLISEGMSQEEMFSHANATLELATMLQQKGQIPEAGQALDILVNQPGIGNHYLIRSLAKHAVVFGSLGDEGKVSQSMIDLQETIARASAEEPDAITGAQAEMSPEELQILAQFV